MQDTQTGQDLCASYMVWCRISDQILVQRGSKVHAISQGVGEGRLSGACCVRGGWVLMGAWCESGLAGRSLDVEIVKLMSTMTPNLQALSPEPKAWTIGVTHDGVNNQATARQR